MTLIKFNKPTDINEYAPSCNGQIFRADAHQYRTQRGFALTVRLNHMKKLSCPGCKYCGWVFDQLGDISNEYPIVGIESAEDGHLYTLEITNQSVDWETGTIDDWDISLKKV